MQVRFTEEQIQQADVVKAKYVQTINAIIAGPDHHGFDAVCAYLREIEKMHDLIFSVIQAQSNKFVAQLAKAMVNDDEDYIEDVAKDFDAKKLQKALQEEINARMIDDAVKKVDEQYKALDSRLDSFIFRSDQNNLQTQKQLFKFLDKGASILHKTYGVKFSDGTELTWNSGGKATEMAAARSEFEHKMAYLANNDRLVAGMK